MSRSHPTCALQALALTSVLTLASTLQAASSVTADYCSNHVFLRASSQSQFVGATSTDSGPPASDVAIAASAFESHPPFRDTVLAASPTLFPFTTAYPYKDRVEGAAKLDFLTGSPITDDTFTVTFNASGSALDAHNFAAEPADAVQRLGVALSFFVDAFFGPTPQPPNVLVGTLELPAVPSVASGVTLIGSITRDSIPILSLSPGTPASTLKLFTNHSYTIAFSYELTIPFGTDPDTSFSYSASIASIPEPSLTPLLLAPSLTLLRRCRR